MKKILLSLLLAVAIGLGSFVTPAQAGEVSKFLTMKVISVAGVTLTLDQTMITFTPSGTNPTPGDMPVNITISAVTSGAGAVLAKLSAVKLVNGGEPMINEDKISWTATGAGWLPGTGSDSNQTIGSWTGSGTRTGVLTFTLAGGTYSAGSWQGNWNFTASCP